MPLKRHIAIFGGTFNPIHNGHLKLARYAVKKLNLDTVYFVPSYIPPHKVITDKITPNDRKNMVKLAIKGNDKFKICLYELNQGKKSYSVKTIRYFKKRFSKQTSVFFLIGADSLDKFKTWKSADKLPNMVQFIAFDRPGYRPKQKIKKIIELTGLKTDISSDNVRDLIKKRKSISKYIPPKVAVYIAKHGLYQK